MLNLDTHILVHALQGTPRKRERELLSQNDWSISAIVLWEIAKLIQLDRLEMDLDDPATTRSLSKVRVWPITLEVCRTMQDLDFKSDPADELIAATSIAHDIPLLTRDKTIRASKLVPLAH